MNNKNAVNRGAFALKHETPCRTLCLHHWVDIINQKCVYLQLVICPFKLNIEAGEKHGIVSQKYTETALCFIKERRQL